MARHKHADMIIAKAENMELVVFINRGGNSEWSVLTNEWEMNFLTGDNSHEFFLCLPQHKDACLHWLNGGEVQVKFARGWGECKPNETWNTESFFMQDSYKIRIKPRKEKRWIAIKRSDATTTCVVAFNSLEQAQKNLSEMSWQFIEIEVEV